MVPSRGAGMLKHGVFSCFWSLRLLTPSYFSAFLEPRGVLGVLWGPRGGSESDFNIFWERFCPHSGGRFSIFFMYFSGHVSELLFEQTWDAILVRLG